MAHGGAENGKLPVTYRDFEEWGVHCNTVAGAIRALAALGLVEITRRGYSGAVDRRAPNWYRLTYVQAWDADDTGTHEYLKIESVEAAEAIAEAARKGADPRNVERSKRNSTALTFCESSPSKSEGESPVVALKK